MTEDVANHQAFFNKYANRNTYQVKQDYYSQSYRVTGSNQPQKQIRETPYNIKNLPIIYDSEPRSSTPTKQPGSSRVVYGQREKTQKYVSSSPVVKYQMMPFAQPRPQVIGIPLNHGQPQQKHKFLPPSPLLANQVPSEPAQLTSEQANSRSRTIIAGLIESKPIDSRTSSIMEKNMLDENVVQIKQEKVEKDQKGGSRIIVENINAYLQPAFSTKSVRSYVSSQVVHSPVPELPPRNPNPPPTSNAPIQIPQGYSSIPPQIPPSNGPPPSTQPTNNKTSLNNLTFMATGNINSDKEFNFVNTSYPTFKQISPAMSHLSTETVPRVQYDKCVNECKNWQTKYNQLYLKYMNLATAIPESNTNQLEMLRQQNGRLRQQLRQQGNKSVQSLPILEAKFNDMVNSQKEAAIRECMLLIQRYKLESRQNKF